MTTYKIIESPPYDKDAPNTFWIRKEVKRFGFTVSSRTIGNYKIDDTYGELGEMPFFDRESAEKRLEILKQ